MRHTGRSIRDAEDARACLTQLAASSLSLPRWAAQNGLHPRSLSYWREKFARSQPLRLLELTPAPASQPEPRVCFLQRGELVLHLDPSWDEATLLRLFRMLRAC